MLADLIRALIPAVLVGVAPGWLWARVLVPTDDTASRLAFAGAFSITLVPAVALVPGRLMGLGVTPIVSAFSALLVLGAGVAAYLRFGPAGRDAKVPEEPLAPPVALGPFALAVLLPALGLAIAAYFGFVPLTSQVMLAGVLLLCFAAVVHTVESRRAATRASAGRTSREIPPEGDPGPLPETSGRGGWATRRLAPQAALAAVIGLVLARAYVGPVLYDWPYVRGVDQYSHTVMANLMLTEGSVESYLVYPPGFHVLSAMVSGLSGLDPLEVFPVLGPALLVLPPLALYALAGRMWGAWCGVAAALVSGLLIGGSYYYFEDGMYPNMVASQFLLVLALCALFEFYRAPSTRTGLSFALLGSAVVLYHPVASLYLVLILTFTVTYFLPYLFLRDRHRGLALLLSLVVLFALSVLYAWDTYDLPQAVAGVLGVAQEAGRGGEAVAMAVGTQIPFEPDVMSTTFTFPVLCLGLFGAALLTANPPGGKGGVPYAFARVTLLVWAVILLFGSRTPLSGFPQRFERDLCLPLALFAAFALVTVLRSVKLRRPLAILAACLAVAFPLLQIEPSFEDAAAPSWRMVMTPYIAESGEWLEEHNDGGNIMVSPHRWNQVPSRMMLAMGDYSALQSFHEEQLRVPRDLPPSGPEPPRDVLWVMNNPGGERTREILAKYDIRYIVLYKNFPGRPPVHVWKTFEGYGDLYRIAFQNRDVVIFEPR